jgi:ribosome assembly protein RRB1
MFIKFQFVFFSLKQATMLGDRHFAATWSETGKVHIWDLSRPLAALDDSNIMATYTRNCESPSAAYTFSGHQVEGFALDWSRNTPGVFYIIQSYNF